MTGTAWHEYQPPTDKEKSFKLLDAYVAAGGNFFDTANGYSVSVLVTECRRDLMS
jgi:aryl-alcohol dehydrogenase-like predicted oxidoreductase